MVRNMSVIRKGNSECRPLRAQRSSGLVLPRSGQHRDRSATKTEPNGVLPYGRAERTIRVLLKFDGKGAGRVKGALQHGPVKVWQYTLRNAGIGKWRFAPGREIELTTADASSIGFGAKIADSSWLEIFSIGGHC